MMNYDFFRRKPNDGQQYNYSGTLMSPRIAQQSIHFSPAYPSHIALPVFDNLPSNFIADQKPSKEYSWSVYPNPCSDYAFVNLPNEKGLVQVYSTNGQLLEEKETDKSFVLDVSRYAPGIYVVKFRSENLTLSRKIIVNR